jgi:hypothetical protein
METFPEVAMMLFYIKQEALGRSNCLISFDTARTPQKTKIGIIRTRTHRDQGDLKSLFYFFKKWGGGRYTDRHR